MSHLEERENGRVRRGGSRTGISGPPAKILGVGKQARLAAASQTAEMVNPFAHPCTLVSDLTVAEQLIKYQMRRLLGNSLLSISHPVIRLQVVESESEELPNPSDTAKLSYSYVVIPGVIW